MIKVLDHGYVNLVTTWGSDKDIIRAARMSTNKGFQGWGDGHDIECPFFHDKEMKTCTRCGTVVGDEKLLAYLYNNKHMTPFEMAGMVIEVQAPIMVFREWHRHRTQSFNEMSGRYTELPDLYYIPSIERLMASKQAKANKQSSEAGFDGATALMLQDSMRESVQQSREEYETLLKYGVAREIARLVLPVNQYSRMRASANLRNWLAFLGLRLPENAQYEIRVYAQAVASLIQQHFPRTYQLFEAAR